MKFQTEMNVMRSSPGAILMYFDIEQFYTHVMHLDAKLATSQLY